MTALSVTITRLLVYPIKSCGPVDLTELVCDRMGPQYDRRFMLVKPDGRFISQRTHPQLALVKPSIANGTLTLRAPRMSQLSFPLAPPTGEETSVLMFKNDLRAEFVAGQANQWFSAYLSEPVQLVTAPHSTRRYHGSPVAFPDVAQFLLVTEESVAALTAREPDYSVLNFRPNIVVRGFEAPFLEESIAAMYGDSIRLESQGACGRCVMPNVDPTTGTRRAEADILGLLKALRPPRAHSTSFGIHMKATTGERMQINDSLTVE